MVVYLSNAFSTSMVQQFKWTLLHIKQIDINEAKGLLSKGFVSAVGHEGTAKVLTQILGVEVKVNRIEVKLNPGDVLLVFQLLQRLPEGVVLTEDQVKALPYKLFVIRVMSYGEL